MCSAAARARARALQSGTPERLLRDHSPRSHISLDCPSKSIYLFEIRFLRASSNGQCRTAALRLIDWPQTTEQCPTQLPLRAAALDQLATSSNGHGSGDCVLTTVHMYWLLHCALRSFLRPAPGPSSVRHHSLCHRDVGTRAMMPAPSQTRRPSCPCSQSASERQTDSG